MIQPEIPNNFLDLDEATRLKIYEAQVRWLQKCEDDLEKVHESWYFEISFSTEFYQHHLEKATIAYQNAEETLLRIRGSFPPNLNL